MQASVTRVSPRGDTYDVYIGRRCTMGGYNLPESIWHNPFSVKSCNGSVHLAVWLFVRHLASNPSLLARLRDDLRGKRLGCWCKPRRCHGDVLAVLANAPDYGAMLGRLRVLEACDPEQLNARITDLSGGTAAPGGILRFCQPAGSNKDA